MKIIKILSIVLLLIVTSTVQGFSKERKNIYRKSVVNLNEEIKDLFDEMPFKEIMCGEKRCSLSVCFKVNDEGKIEIHHILGKNNKLVDFSRDIFAQNELNADKDIFHNDLYWIKIVFKYKEF